MTSKFSVYNNTNNPLEDGEIFTGMNEDVSKYDSIIITCKSSTNSQLSIEYSSDKTNYDYIITHDLIANNDFSEIIINRLKYVRIKITNNSGSNQTYLRLSTKLVNNLQNNSNNEILNNLSTSTLLDIDETFNSGIVNVSKFSSLSISLFSDVDSVDGGVKLKFSQDGINYDFIKKYKLEGGEQFNKSITIISKFIEIEVNNGSIAQGEFRLQTIGHQNELGRDKAQTIKYESKMIDSSGRLKITKQYNIIDVIHTNTIDTKSYLIVSEKTTGSGVSTKNANTSTIEMNVSGNGDSVIRQSRRYCIYQPGKTLICQMTGILNADSNANTVVSKLGYFNENNGFYFQYTNGILSVVKRTKVSGSVVETVINQDDFNVDSLNGIGESGYNIDISKCQLYYIEGLWQGVGVVRMGCLQNGNFITAHKFKTNNELTNVFTTTFSLPIRYEITSSGGAGQLDMICGTVFSDGGYHPLGNHFSVINSSKISTSSTELPILALRLKSNAEHTNIFLTDFGLANNNNNSVFYQIYKFMDVSDLTNIYASTPPTFNSVDDYSLVEYAETGTFNSTGGLGTDLGRLLKSGTFTGKSHITESFDLSTTDGMELSKNIDGTSDIIILAANNLSGSSVDLIGNFSWKEIY